MNDKINLVNEKGTRAGSIGKLEAHIRGELHEAFSIFIFNENKELLLQKRAMKKYHSGGLWTNTCCSHPRVGEKLETAVHRRLEEEMGLDCELKKTHAFAYRAEQLSNGLIENEFDHVFVGNINKKTKIIPNQDEVCECRWVRLEDLKEEIKKSPQLFTEWMKIILRNPEFIEIKTI